MPYRHNHKRLTDSIPFHGTKSHKKEINKQNLVDVSANHVRYAYHLTGHCTYDKNWEIISLKSYYSLDGGIICVTRDEIHLTLWGWYLNDG